MKIKDCTVDDLCDYLKGLNCAARKLGDNLKKNDIDGSHLILLDEDFKKELCQSIGMKLELNKLILNRDKNLEYDDEVNEDKYIKKPTSMNVNPHHSGMSCIVKKKGTSKEIEVEVSKHGFNFSKIDDGTYDAKFLYKKDLSSPILLKQSEFTKKGSVITPDFMDLSSSFVQLSFDSEDLPASNCRLTGKINLPPSTINGASSLTINSLTNDQGKYSLIMPQGNLSINVKGTVNGKSVDISNSYDIEVPKNAKSIDDAKNVKPRSFGHSVGCKKFILNIKSNMVVYLFDTSGSMDAVVNGKHQMDKVKELAHEKLKEGLSLGKKIAFAQWDYDITFPLNGQWIDSSHVSTISTWIGNLKAYGGTVMKNAIEKSILKYPNAEEFVICCDGDISPFDMCSWDDFVKRNPGYRYTFVGIGSSANETMSRMAQIGNGEYYKKD